jgi:hypothetical protein
MIQAITVFEKWLKKYKTMTGGSLINKDLSYRNMCLK